MLIGIIALHFLEKCGIRLEQRQVVFGSEETMRDLRVVQPQKHFIANQKFTKIIACLSKL